MRPRFSAVISLFAVAFVAGCTIESQNTPPLTGPSEFGISITISITPDVLTQDGASQSVVTVSARDSNGAPMRNLSLRAAIEVGGVRADFGALSARNLVTGGDGRATVVYTAPLGPAIPVDTGTVVTIAITPIGSDFNNSSSRFASIRLVPPGVILPPDGLRPKFVFTPDAPVDSQPVLFTACQDQDQVTAPCALPGNPIAAYSWNFGDGGRAAGPTASHSFDTAGTYIVTLTISDGYGRTASVSRSVAVTGGAPPTVVFSSSPATPTVSQMVNFNASAARAAAGRTIQSYEWDFGDGTSGQGLTTSHAYSQAAVYTVVLTVTDDSGKKSTATGTVTVSSPNPVAAFTASPTSPNPGQLVSFNASGSVAVAGRTIAGYSWDFGDGSSGSGTLTSHSYAARGTYVVVLTVTDDSGRRGIVSREVIVVPPQ